MKKYGLLILGTHNLSNTAIVECSFVGQVADIDKKQNCKELCERDFKMSFVAFPAGEPTFITY